MTETKSAKIFGIKEIYNRIERVVDRQGRVLGFKNILPAERKDIDAMTPGLDGTMTVKMRTTGDDGIEREQEIEVSRRTDLYLAASLREVDGRPMLFPRNKKELDAVFNALDDDGLSAAMEALIKINTDQNKEDDAKPPDLMEQAKN